VKEFKIEQSKGKLRITPINTIEKQKSIIINDNPLMSLRELKQQIADNYNVKINEIDLLII
jgi:hypothetical protein